MSDNVTLPGTGAVIATDEVTDSTLGTVEVQFVKLMDGTLDSTNKLVVNSDGSVNVVANAALMPGGNTVVGTTGTMSGTMTAAAQTVSLSNGTQAYSTVALTLSGTFVGTVVFEGTVDGTNYVSIPGSVPATGATVTSTTAGGTWAFDIAGLTAFRARCSVYTSGTMAIVGVATSAQALVGIDQPLPAGTNAIGSVTLGSGSNTVGIARAAGLGYTANPSAVSNGAQQNVMLDKMGRVIVVSGHVRDMVGTQATTLTSTTTATTVVTAAGTSVFADITSLIISNGSATATAVTLSDGSVSYSYNLPAGGGLVSNFDPPLKATTSNVAWTLQCGTSVASVYCNIVYVKNL